MVVNVQVYCSFIGNTGWNNHVRDFLSNLNHDILNVKVTNFTVDDNFKKQKNKRTGFKSVGTALEDLVGANLAYSKFSG